MADKPKGEKRFEIEEDLSKAEIPEVLPVLPLRGIVIFPSQIHPFLVSRPSSLKLIEDVGQTTKIIALAAQRNPEDEHPAPEGLFQHGTAVRILKMLRYPDQSVRVLVQGLARIQLGEFTQREPYFLAHVTRLMEPTTSDKEVDALHAHLVSQFSKFVSLVPYLPDELQVMAMQVKEASRLADMVASYMKIAIEEGQDLLSTLDVRARLEKLIAILGREIEMLELGHKIQSQVQTELNKNQREYYLRQQLKAIQKELGEGDARTSEVEDVARGAQSCPQGTRAPQNDTARVGRAYGGAHLPRLAGESALGCFHRGQPGYPPRAPGARRRSLRSRKDQRAHPRIPGGAQAQEGHQGTHPVLRRASGHGQDFARQIDRARTRAQVRAPVARRNPRRGRNSRPSPDLHRIAAGPHHPGDAQRGLQQPALHLGRGGQARNGFPRRSG